eukprot:g13802.t1
MSDWQQDLRLALNSVRDWKDLPPVLNKAKRLHDVGQLQRSDDRGQSGNHVSLEPSPDPDIEPEAAEAAVALANGHAQSDAVVRPGDDSDSDSSDGEELMVKRGRLKDDLTDLLAEGSERMAQWAAAEDKTLYAKYLLGTSKATCAKKIDFLMKLCGDNAGISGSLQRNKRIEVQRFKTVQELELDQGGMLALEADAVVDEDVVVDEAASSSNYVLTSNKRPVSAVDPAPEPKRNKQLNGSTTLAQTAKSQKAKDQKEERRKAAWRMFAQRAEDLTYLILEMRGFELATAFTGLSLPELSSGLVMRSDVTFKPRPVVVVRIAPDGTNFRNRNVLNVEVFLIRPVLSRTGQRTCVLQDLVPKTEPHPDPDIDPDIYAEGIEAAEAALPGHALENGRAQSDAVVRPGDDSDSDSSDDEELMVKRGRLKDDLTDLLAEGSERMAQWAAAEDKTLYAKYLLGTSKATCAKKIDFLMKLCGDTAGISGSLQRNKRIEVQRFKTVQELENLSAGMLALEADAVVDEDVVVDEAAASSNHVLTSNKRPVSAVDPAPEPKRNKQELNGSTTLAQTAKSQKAKDQMEERRKAAWRMFAQRAEDLTYLILEMRGFELATAFTGLSLPEMSYGLAMTSDVTFKPRPVVVVRIAPDGTNFRNRNVLNVEVFLIRPVLSRTGRRTCALQDLVPKTEPHRERQMWCFPYLYTQMFSTTKGRKAMRAFVCQNRESIQDEFAQYLYDRHHDELVNSSYSTSDGELSVPTFCLLGPTTFGTNAQTTWTETMQSTCANIKKDAPGIAEDRLGTRTVIARDGSNLDFEDWVRYKGLREQYYDMRRNTAKKRQEYEDEDVEQDRTKLHPCFERAAKVTTWYINMQGMGKDWAGKDLEDGDEVPASVRHRFDVPPPLTLKMGEPLRGMQNVYPGVLLRRKDADPETDCWMVFTTSAGGEHPVKRGALMKCRPILSSEEDVSAYQLERDGLRPLSDWALNPVKKSANLKMFRYNVVAGEMFWHKNNFLAVKCNTGAWSAQHTEYSTLVAPRNHEKDLGDRVLQVRDNPGGHSRQDKPRERRWKGGTYNHFVMMPEKNTIPELKNNYCIFRPENGTWSLTIPLGWREKKAGEGLTPDLTTALCRSTPRGLLDKDNVAEMRRQVYKDACLPSGNNMASSSSSASGGSSAAVVPAAVPRSSNSDEMSLDDKVKDFQERLDLGVDEDGTVLGNAAVVKFVEENFQSDLNMGGEKSPDGSITVTFALLSLMFACYWNVLRKASRVDELAQVFAKGAYHASTWVVICKDTWYGVLSGMHSVAASKRFCEKNLAAWLKIGNRVKILRADLEKYPELLQTYVEAKNTQGDVMKATFWEKFRIYPKIELQWNQYQRKPYPIEGKILGKPDFYKSKCSGVQNETEIKNVNQAAGEGWTMNGTAFFLSLLQDHASTEDEKTLPSGLLKSILIPLKLGQVSKFVRDGVCCVFVMLHCLFPKVHQYISVMLQHPATILSLCKQNFNPRLHMREKEQQLTLRRIYFSVRIAFLGPGDLLELTPVKPEVYIEDPSKYFGTGATPESHGLVYDQPWQLRQRNTEEQHADAMAEFIGKMLNSGLSLRRTHCCDTANYGTHTVLLKKFAPTFSYEHLKIQEKKKVKLAACCDQPSHRLYKMTTRKGISSTMFKMDEDEEGKAKAHADLIATTYKEKLKILDKNEKTEKTQVNTSFRVNKKALKRQLSDNSIEVQKQEEMKKIEDAYGERKKKEEEAYDEQLKEAQAEAKKITASKEKTHCQVKMEGAPAKHAGGYPIPLECLAIDEEYYRDLVTIPDLDDDTVVDITGEAGNVIPVELPGKVTVSEDGSISQEEFEIVILWKASGVADEAKFVTAAVDLPFKLGTATYRIEAKVILPAAIVKKVPKKEASETEAENGAVAAAGNKKVSAKRKAAEEEDNLLDSLFAEGQMAAASKKQKGKAGKKTG